MTKDQEYPYQVWMTQGQEPIHVADMIDLESSIAFANEFIGEGSFAVKLPDGTWHKWDESSN